MPRPWHRKILGVVLGLLSFVSWVCPFLPTPVQMEKAGEKAGDFLILGLIKVPFGEYFFLGFLSKSKYTIGSFGRF